MLMPEEYIIKRLEHEANGNANDWWNKFKSLTKKESNEAVKIINSKDFKMSEYKTTNKKIIKLIEHYTNKN